jgi:two-component system nitrate/nitrite response regulator NarL
MLPATGTGRPAMKTSIRTVIVDDHLLFLESLRGLLRSEDDIEVIGQATDAASAIRVIKDSRPDLVILDFSMPPMSGLDVLRDLAAAKHSVPILMVTAGASDGEVLESIELGARGVVLKHARPDMLIRAIRAVMAGQYWINRERIGDMVQHLRAPQETSLGPDGLPMHFTPRQIQIMSAIVAGGSNRGIAKDLAIRPTTVKYHLAQLFEKTGTTNRVALARMITMRGLHTPSRIRRRG